jgi:hypothetical protein
MLRTHLKNTVKRMLSINPWLYSLGWALHDLRKPIYRVGDDPAKDSPFDSIYKANSWACDESRSGCGSTLAYTEPLRRDFRKLVARYHVGSLLDAPCGDFNWMQHVEFPDAFQYIGGDIVQDLVDELSRNYESGGRRFVRLDVTRDELPSADLWLCRDCLFHLPNADILAALKNFQKSDIKYLLTTTFTFPRSNMDIEHGEFRYLNLELTPFSLPKPLAYIKDYVVPFAPRWLGLWSRAQLEYW